MWVHPSGNNNGRGKISHNKSLWPNLKKVRVHNPIIAIRISDSINCPCAYTSHPHPHTLLLSILFHFQSPLPISDGFSSTYSLVSLMMTIHIDIFTPVKLFLFGRELHTQRVKSNFRRPRYHPNIAFKILYFTFIYWVDQTKCLGFLFST
jgi:hypothetical protein